MTRDEARSRFIPVLLEKVRDDPYPSATQLAPPSIPMLQRIQRVAESLPRYERQSD